MKDYSTNFKDGQHNDYHYYGKNHDHEFYDTETGIMGYHGENTPKENKKWGGQRAGDLHIGKGKK